MILAITQARVSSSRLKEKVLKIICDKSILEIHLQRILKSKNIDKLVVATANEEGHEKIEEIAKKINVDCFVGSIDNVLERFYKAAVQYNPEIVIRLTSDCPLIDSSIIDEMIEKFKSLNVDYMSNCLNPTYPDGVDVEIFTFKALEHAFKNVTLKSDQEHVTPYIWRNSDLREGKIFKGHSFENKINQSQYRLTIDTIEDFEVVGLLISKLGISESFNKYCQFLDQNKEVKEINLKYRRNEGYEKSLKEDYHVKKN